MPLLASMSISKRLTEGKASGFERACRVGKVALFWDGAAVFWNTGMALPYDEDGCSCGECRESHLLEQAAHARRHELHHAADQRRRDGRSDHRDHVGVVRDAREQLHLTSGRS